MYKEILQELTFEIARDKKFNWIACVKYYWPEMTDEDADSYLWNETCFPFSDEGTLKQMYNEYIRQKNRLTLIL